MVYILNHNIVYKSNIVHDLIFFHIIDSLYFSGVWFMYPKDSLFIMIFFHRVLFDVKPKKSTAHIVKVLESHDCIFCPPAKS